VLAVAIAAAAFVAGLTGAWSPCGFSIVETVGAAERRIGLAASCATFALGALAGGVATFAGLAAAGALVPGAGKSLLVPAAALALAAALAEARGVRVVPQIRRQVPEPWRRRLPLPLAAWAYGVLLGVGFATFVLTLAVWALAAISFAVGDVRLGLLAGLAFGAGRALPIVVLAPISGRALGREIVDVMAMEPRVLRGFRFADAVALTACAGALASGNASAATVVAQGASDPTAAAGAIAWDAGGKAVLLLGHAREPAGAHHLGPLASPLPGRDPALGGSMLGWREGELIRVVRVSDFAPVAELSVAGVDALAVNDAWLAYRTHRSGRDRIAVRRLEGGDERVVAVAPSLSALGRPALAGNLLVFHVATPRVSRIVGVDLRRGRAEVLRSSRIDELTNPAVRAGQLLYVRQTALAQQLLMGPLDAPRRDRVLYRTGPVGIRDTGHEHGYSHVTRSPRPRRARSLLWTTALTPRAAFVTLMPVRGGAAGARILRVGR
jgi:hypothetical protein